MIDYVLPEAHFYIERSALHRGELRQDSSRLFRMLPIKPRQARAATHSYVSRLAPVRSYRGPRLYRNLKMRVLPARHAG